MTYDPAVDVQYMQQALELARGGLGFVSPNPLVGCVLVKDGAVVGRGYHQRFGGPHAEVYALHEAGPQARGAVLYVTLEPCSHTGKTPPCADAVIQAGVSRVVVLPSLRSQWVCARRQRTNSMKRLSNTLLHTARL